MRRSRWSKPLALALGLSLVAAACGDDDDDDAATDGHDRAPTETSRHDGGRGGETDFLGCQVTDTGGVDDRSFNQTAFAGLRAAADEVGFEPERARVAAARPTTSRTSQAHARRGAATSSSRSASCSATPPRPRRRTTPTSKFAIVDNDFFDIDAGEDITFDNVRELTFATDQAAFLAGYVAAATTRDRHHRHLRRHQPSRRSPSSWTASPPASRSTTRDTGEDVQLVGWDPAAAGRPVHRRLRERRERAADHRAAARPGRRHHHAGRRSRRSGHRSRRSVPVAAASGSSGSTPTAASASPTTATSS